MTTTTQAGLNNVVRSKVQRMVDGKQSTVEQTIQRLQYEGKISRDFIAPIGVALQNRGERPQVTFSGDGIVHMNIKDEQFRMHNHAIGHLASKFKIPTRYMKDLAEGNEWQKNLAAHLLNEHSTWTEKQRMLIRSVGHEVRGVLSDSYRRLDSQQILIAFIQSAIEQKAVICDAHMSDTKIWVETIFPEPLIINSPKNGEIHAYMGARLANSDYGDGALQMNAFLMNGVCLNGMVRENMLRQIHLGGKLPENLILSDETYKSDTKTTVLTIRDVTRNIYSSENFEKRRFEIERASATDIDPEETLVGMFKKAYLLKDEVEEIKSVLINNRQEDGMDGEMTLWKLTQAMTAYARDLDNPVRARELHEVAGNLFDTIK